MSALPQHRPGRQRAPRAARGGCSFTQPTAAGPAEMAVSIIFKGILDTGGSDRACRGLSVRDARATRRWQDSQYGKRYGPDNLLHASPTVVGWRAVCTLPNWSGQAVDRGADRVATLIWPTQRHIRIPDLPPLDRQYAGRRLGSVHQCLRGTTVSDQPSKDELRFLQEMRMTEAEPSRWSSGWRGSDPGMQDWLGNLDGVGSEQLVAMLEPYKGRVYDRACGSGGMLVQSATNFVQAYSLSASEIEGDDPTGGSELPTCAMGLPTVDTVDEREGRP